jgi:hypothetical protein
MCGCKNAEAICKSLSYEFINKSKVLFPADFAKRPLKNINICHKLKRAPNSMATY